MADSSIVNDDEYEGLLRMLDIAIWKKLKVRMTDQALFNLYFAGRQYLAGAKFNYLLRHSREIEKKEAITLKDACVLHFNGPAKPWLPEKMIRDVCRPEGMASFRLWQDGQ